MKIYSAEQIKRTDADAIYQYGIDGIVLMENAACAVVNQIASIENIKKERALIVCGRGNNGGDGFAIARHLLNIFDDVKIAFFDDVKKLAGDCEKNYQIAKKLRIDIINDTDEMREYLDVCDVIVDALYGFSFHGEFCERDEKIVRLINLSKAYVVAVDVPSGLCADTGECKLAVMANKTITFTGYKMAHLTFPAASYCGKVIAVNIGIPDKVCDRYSLGEVISQDFVKSTLLSRRRNAHKGTCGKVFLVGGSRGMSGAVCMSAYAAIRSGAGLVTAGVPMSINDVFEQKVTEAMSLALPEINGRISKEATEQILDFAKGYDVLVIGSGMGRSDDVGYILRECLAKYDKNIIIDADALFALSHDTSILDNTKANIIITPHHAEMGRLMGKSAEYVEKNSIQCACEFSKDHNVTVVLKGAYTVIAGKGKLYVNSLAGNQGMATGGSGDVLAGVIGALCAAGNEPTDASACGVYIHALAGDKAKKHFGMTSMAACDIVDFLSKAFCEIVCDNE